MSFVDLKTFPATFSKENMPWFVPMEAWMEFCGLNIANNNY